MTTVKDFPQIFSRKNLRPVFTADDFLNFRANEEMCQHWNLYRTRQKEMEDIKLQARTSFSRLKINFTVNRLLTQSDARSHTLARSIRTVKT